MSGAGRVPGPPPSAGARVPVHGALPGPSMCPRWCLQSGVPAKCVVSSVPAKCPVSSAPVCDRSSIFIAVDQTERRGGVWFREGVGFVLYKIYL